MTRLHYAFLAAATIALGLASRLPGFPLPKQVGDTLYATMAFWLVGFLSPQASPARKALAALLFCVFIEFAKFIDTPLRQHPLGHLVLGTAFQAWNLPCYAAGAWLAFFLERHLVKGD